MPPLPLASKTCTIGGWRIRLFARDDPAIRYRIDATDYLWNSFAEAYGLDVYDAIDKLAPKINVHRETLIRELNIHQGG